MQFPKSSLLLLPYLSASISALPSPGSGNAILSVRQQNRFPPEGVVCQTAQENNTYSNAALQAAWANVAAFLEQEANPQRGTPHHIDPAVRGKFDPNTQVDSNSKVVWYSYTSSMLAYALTREDLMIISVPQTSTGNYMYSAVLTNSDAVAAGTGTSGNGRYSVNYHQCNDVAPAPAR